MKDRERTARGCVDNRFVCTLLRKLLQLSVKRKQADIRAFIISGAGSPKQF